jgi:hypothetical protein
MTSTNDTTKTHQLPPSARARAWAKGKKVLSRSFQGKSQFVAGAGISGALIGAICYSFDKISSENDNMQKYLPEARELIHVQMYDPLMVRTANDLLHLVKDFIPSQWDKLVDCIRIIEAIALCWYAASVDGVMHACTSDLAFQLSKEAGDLINDLILCVPFKSRISAKMTDMLQELYDLQGELQDSVFALVKYHQL